MVVGNVVADYILKSTTVSKTSACKLSFYCAKLRIKVNTQVDQVIMLSQTLQQNVPSSDFPRDVLAT
jgi:hypothetical protein